MKISRLCFVLISVVAFCNNKLYAQTEKVEMADVMRSNGKIYAVVAVCLTILFGLIFYVFSIDRKITKMEKEKS